MRIGQFTDSFLPIVDGVGRVVASYARTLGQMGHEVTVFAPQADMGDLTGQPFDVVTYNAFPMPGKMPYRIGFPALDIPFEKKLSALSLDVIHVHSPFMAGHAGLHMAKKHRLPVVGSFHSKYYDDFSQTLKVEALAKGGVKLVVDFYAQCDEAWAVSGSTAETLREYGYKDEVVVMPNGTDVRTLDETVLPELTRRYALEPGVPVLLYVGQLNWKKNIRRILEAVKLLKERGVKLRLLLAGQGPHREEIEEEGRAMGIDDRMTFVGHLQQTRELDGLYSLASLFVFPSLYDNAPMVLREAAAMGTPAVLIEGSHSAEGVTDGINGLTCRDEAGSLADAIAGGLADPERLKRIGQAARETIPVPWQLLMQQVADRYERLVAICAR